MRGLMSCYNVSGHNSLGSLTTLLPIVRMTLEEFKKSLMTNRSSTFLTGCPTKMQSLIEVLNSEIKENELNLALEDFEIDPRSNMHNLFLIYEKRLGPTLFFFTPGHGQDAYKLVKIHHLNGDNFQVTTYPLQYNSVSSDEVKFQKKADVQLTIEEKCFYIELGNKKRKLENNATELQTQALKVMKIHHSLPCVQTPKLALQNPSNVQKPVQRRYKKTVKAAGDKSNHPAFQRLLRSFKNEVIKLEEAKKLQEDLNNLNEYESIAIKNIFLQSSKKIFSCDSSIILFDFTEGEEAVYTIVGKRGSNNLKNLKYPIENGQIHGVIAKREISLEKAGNFIEGKLKICKRDKSSAPQVLQIAVKTAEDAISTTKSVGGNANSTALP